MELKYKLGFIGAGNMAWAIASGVVKAGLYAGSEVIAADIAEQRRELFSRELAAAATEDNSRVAKESELIVLAIKPQQAKAVLEPLAGMVGSEQLVISIMAGVSTAGIEKMLGGQAVVVRVMPNLAISVGAGMTAVAAGSRAKRKHVETVCKLFDVCGATIVVEEEQMHAVTAVSGSGPAYFFYFVESLIEAGIEAGLRREQAELLAKQTSLGAAKTLVQRTEAPAELRRQVTSKGGTTAAALEVMQKANVSGIISRAVSAAAKRSGELGK